MLSRSKLIFIVEIRAVICQDSGVTKNRRSVEEERRGDWGVDGEAGIAEMRG
jgi:hypothetical protein